MARLPPPPTLLMLTKRHTTIMTILGWSFDRQRDSEREDGAHQRRRGRSALVGTQLGEERGRLGSAGGRVSS